MGVFFNSKLHFSTYISQIVTKAKQRIYLLFKSFSSSTANALILAYKTYILPIVEYCSPVWSPCLVTDVLAVESVQRLFTRRLKPCLNLNYNERLTFCGLVSLERRRLIADLVLIYKIIHKLVDIHLDNSLTFCSGPTRGHSYKLEYKGARINSRLHFFTVRSIKVWNSLPDLFVTSDSLAVFRNSLNYIDFTRFLLI